MNLDKKDNKILEAILNNARDSITTIAKKTSLTREQVTYRINKLEKEGIIKGYIARIHQPIFCSGVATILCKLKSTSNKRMTEIIAAIKNHKNVNWFSELCGTYDLVIVFLYKNSTDLAQTITDITNHIGANLKEHALSIYVSEYKFDRKILLTAKTTDKISEPITFTKPKIEIDETDLKILRQLSTNARIKNNELSKKTGISEDMIRIKIKKLEHKGVIRGYDTVIDELKIGYEGYYIGLRMEQMNEKTISKIKYYSNINQHIVYCVRTSGQYNIIINMHAKNRAHFIKLLSEMRQVLEPELEDFEFQIIIDVHKEVHVPIGMLELGK